MLNLLLVISYYDFNISKQSDSYFQLFPFLQYSFQKNAQYFIGFSSKQESMVFGFATKKEIQKIKELKNISYYCYGLYKITQIQHIVYKGVKIHGKITSKSTLTPYAITCNKSYTINSRINYTNGSNQLDNRIQHFRKFLIFYFVLVLLATVGFIIYTTLYFYRNEMLSFQRNSMIGLAQSLFCNVFIIMIGGFFILCFLFGFQSFFIFYFFDSRKNNEYFDVGNKVVNEYDEYGDLKSQDTIFSIVIHLFIIMYFIIIAFFFYRKNLQCCTQLVAIVYAIASFVVFVCCLTTEYSKGNDIFNIIVFVIYVCVTMIFLKGFIVTRIAMFVYYVGSFVSFTLGHILVNTTNEKISSHMLTMILSIILAIAQIFTILFFFLAIFYFREFDNIQISELIYINITFYHQESSFTVINQNETTQYE